MDFTAAFHTYFLHGVTLGLGIWLTVYATNRGWLYFKSLMS
jgi:hypothetical protein